MADLDARLEPVLRLLELRIELVRELAHRQSAAKPELVELPVASQFRSELPRPLKSGQAAVPTSATC